MTDTIIAVAALVIIAVAMVDFIHCTRTGRW